MVDRGFEPRSGKTKDYKIGMCCFSAKHAALRRKNKDWLALNQNNVCEWGNMSTCRLLLQWASTIKIQLSVLVWYKADLIIISLKINNLFSPWYSWKIAELVLNNNHSLIHFILYHIVVIHMLDFILTCQLWIWYQPLTNERTCYIIIALELYTPWFSIKQTYPF
jgi:hypothetical protein